MRNISLQMKGIHEGIDTSEIRTHYDYEELLNKDSEIDLRYTSYWEIHDEKFIRNVIQDDVWPGHAGEYETSVAMYMFPDLVDEDAIKNDPLGTSSNASKEKGEQIYKDIINQYSKIISEMLQ